MSDIQSGARWIAGFAIALLVTGGAQTYLGVVRPLIDTLRARSWVEARIVSGAAMVGPFDGTWYASFSYVYEYRGQRFSGTRYAFTHPTGFLDHDALLDLRRLPATCFVDPAQPWNAVIERQLPPVDTPTRPRRHATLGSGWWPVFAGRAHLARWVAIRGFRYAFA